MPPHRPPTRSRRTLSPTGLLLAVLTLLLGVLPNAALALPGDGYTPDPPDPSVPWAAPADGFDWSVPERFTQSSDGRLNWHYDEATGRYSDDYVRPGSWPVNFYGCQTPSDAATPAATANTYTFLSADGQGLTDQRCAIQLWFPSEGSYEVRMTVTAPDGSVLGRWGKTVVVKDLLIVSLGDSYASGEGNPEYRRQEGQTYGDWVDDRCHRSSYAGPAQAARELERSDPKTSVTFLSFACSGATIDRDYLDYDEDVEQYKSDVWDPYKPGSPSRNNGSGVLGAYRGAQPPTSSYNDKVPSQLDQLRTALALASTPVDRVREIDALVVSAGGNDAGFGLLAAACLVQEDCVHPDVKYTDVDGSSKVTLGTRVSHDLAALPARYQALHDALAAIPNLKIADTYVTEYPDPGTELSDEGAVVECGEILEDIMWLPAMEIEGLHAWDRAWGSELSFARKTFLPGLNGAIRNAATRHGWHYVDGISAGFAGHGYCVGANDSDHPDRFVRTAAMASVYQGPDAREKTKGTLHPNERGHRVYRDRILDKVRPRMSTVRPDGNVLYAFDSTPPTAAATVAPAANPAGWHTGPVAVTVIGRAAGTNTMSHLEHSLDGGAWRRSEGTPVTLPVTGDGVHTLAYRAVDRNENVSAEGTTTVRIDSHAPTAPQLSLDGIAGESDWWRGPVKVTLAAEDVGPSGVVAYQQRESSGAWQPVSGTVATVSADGRHALEYRAVDAAGNAGQALAVGIDVDATVPEVACAAADGKWHGANIDIACSGSDATSGLADSGHGEFTLATTVVDGVETDAATTGSVQVCDVAGNCATAGPVTGNRIDRKSPTLTVTMPETDDYILGEPVVVSYSCSDGGSGVASCVGPVADGGDLNTATVGTNAFPVDAADRVGNQASTSVSYRVTYNVCPLFDQGKAYRAGQTIPIKLQLCDVAGGNASIESVVVTAVRLEKADNSAVTAIVEDAGNANPGDGFRYDSRLEGYIYNLDTRGLSAGTWKLTSDAAGDDIRHSVTFDVR